MTKQRKLPPGPKGNLLLGSVGAVRKDPLGFFMNCARTYPEISHMKFAHIKGFLVDSPEILAYISVTNKSNYKKSPLYQVARDVVGEGLFTAEGEKWRKHRKIAQPIFSHKSIFSMLPTIGEVADSFLDDLCKREQGEDGLPLDVTMMHLTQNIIVRLLFGNENKIDNASLTSAWMTINEEVERRWYQLSPLSRVLPTPANRKFWKAGRVLNSFVEEVIAERRAGKGDSRDIVSAFLAAVDPDSGESFSDVEVRDEVFTFFIAGHESTSMTLTWTLLSILRDARIYDELRREVGGLSESDLASSELLTKAPFLKMVVDESLRLYPPVWGLSRTPIEDDELGGYFVPKNSIVIVSPFVSHRNPKYWPEPDRFIPERFREFEKKPFVYFPFGFGRRACIGASLALYEVMIVIAKILRRFDLVCGDTSAVEPRALVTIKPNVPVDVRWRERRI